MVTRERVTAEDGQRMARADGNPWLPWVRGALSDGSHDGEARCVHSNGHVVPVAFSIMAIQNWEMNGQAFAGEAAACLFIVQ